MTEDRLRADQTAARMGQDLVGSRSRRRQAAIVVVGRDVATLAALDRELSRRYRTGYRIVVCGRPAELEPQVKELLNAGTPVALVIGGSVTRIRMASRYLPGCAILTRRHPVLPPFAGGIGKQPDASFMRSPSDRSVTG